MPRLRQGSQITPLLCLRRECLTCMGGSSQLVAECETRGCDLHSHRFGKRVPGERSALRAIRAFCLACVDGSDVEVKNCTGPCHLHFYRLGKNPKLKGKGKGRDMSKVSEAAQKGIKHRLKQPLSLQDRRTPPTP